MEIKYSICMCNYNMDSTLENSLKSIFNQLNENYEVVVVDDGSSDNSLSLLMKLRENYNNWNNTTYKRCKKKTWRNKKYINK